jgi:hypothetical protein
MKRNKIDIKKTILKRIEYNHSKYILLNKKGHNNANNIMSRVNNERRACDTVTLSNISTNENILKYFSVVIPTMWRSDKLLKMLPVYENSEYVKEIIIIDNDPTKTINLNQYTKVRYYTKGKNIFVNPSWNWGFALSNYNLILANDDVIIHDFNNVMKLISNSDCDIIGIKLHRAKDNNVYDDEEDKSLRISPIEFFPAMGYGYFMFVKNYVYIPDQLKIWYGDKILFDVNKKRGILRNVDIDADKGKTINSNINEFRNKIAQNDIKIYEALTQPTDELNIIIRTSGRPAYFSKCINSIKKHNCNAKLHITIDNIEDLGYVKKCASRLKYNYYLIDKEVVTDICKKIKINKDPFIYNYYFNIVKPYLNGWCIFLDDDDELLMKPEFEKNIKNIYLHKVNIIIKTVPSDNNFGKTPVVNDISGIGIVFHSSQMVDWTPQRTGDYFFISELYRNNNPVWINKILSKTQTGGNFGKRNDLNK